MFNTQLQPFHEALQQHPYAEQILPGLTDLRSKQIDPATDLSRTELLRGILTSFENSPVEGLKKAYYNSIKGALEEEQRDFQTSTRTKL